MNIQRISYASISTHTPHARRDYPLNITNYANPQFLLTRLMRGVTWYLIPEVQKIVFLLTRLMRGVTFAYRRIVGKLKISTHTPHARRDADMLEKVLSAVISTHTPHARRDPVPEKLVKSVTAFLLTRLMRGVTILSLSVLQLIAFLLTRLMRGVTIKLLDLIRCNFISTHTPHARRDKIACKKISYT